jgi:hypothetical protein
MKLARLLVAIAFFAAAAGFAQDPTVAFPQNYKLVLENADFAVLRVHYGPHEKVGMHDHSDHSTVYVYLNDSGPVRFQHTEEPKPFDVTRPPTHAGAFRVSPGRIEKHSVENLSDLPSEYLRVELKRLPVKSLAAEFRGAAPVPPLRPGRTVAYDNPKLRIERFICPSIGDCTLPYPSSEAVLVRIPNHPLSAQQWAREYRIAGSEDDESIVLEPWHKGWGFAGDGSGPYQVLRISIPTPARIKKQ